MAVLSHNGEIKAFYGSEAYIQAMDEADNGDVITLSSGMFDATDISKSVMIRGAGMENDTITGREATYIVGDYAVAIDNEVKELTIEGICFSETMHVWEKGCLDYVTFNKCKFTRDDWRGGMVTNDSVAVKCVFKDCKATRLPRNQTSLEAYNCYFGQLVPGHFYNCVFWIGGSGNEPEFQYSHVYNSVVFVTGHVYLLNGNHVSFSNTLMVSDRELNDTKDCFGGPYFHYDCPSYNVKFISIDSWYDFPGMFKHSNFNNDYLNKCDFILSDLYDNSVYGMYGGPSPYTPFLNVPTITRMSVDAESDEKGLLGVDIEVSGVK